MGLEYLIVSPVIFRRMWKSAVVRNDQVNKAMRRRWKVGDSFRKGQKMPVFLDVAADWESVALCLVSVDQAYNAPALAFIQFGVGNSLT